MMENKMTDKETILNGGWVPCRLCEAMFRRLRQTARYCANCENGFCEGEHGSFAYGHGRCIVCGAHKSYKTQQFECAPAEEKALA